MIRRDPFENATLVECDERNGCRSVEKFGDTAELPIVAQLSKRRGWLVEFVFGEHYRCKCLRCRWDEIVIGEKRGVTA